MNLQRFAAVFAAVCLAAPCIPAVRAETPAPRAGISVTFNDDSGYTLQNNASVQDDFDGGALCLDGVGQYAEIQDTSFINSIEGDFTVSIYFKPMDNKSWSRIFDIGTGEDKYIFLTPSSSGNPDKPRFVIKYNDREQVIDSERDYSFGCWNHLAVTRAGGVTTIYLNGIAAGSTKNITYNFKDVGTTDKNYFGKSMYLPDPFFNGMIDNFFVSDKALDAEEIKTMAGETYYRELELIKEDIFQSDAYLGITTTACNADTNEKIQIFSDTDNLLVTSYLKNYRDEKTDITITPVKDGTNGTEKTITLLPGEEFIYSDTFSGSEAAEYKLLIKDSADGKTYDGGRIVRSDTVFPPASPPDSGTTTDGAHDPSIFKDPNSKYFYAYSSHNVIFRSTDLINWEKYYVFQNISVPDSCKNFIDKNYTDTTANGTYWAPDVIYTEGEEYPYWMYVSVSCGLGGRNSVIGLLKSKKAGFWADPESDVQDIGVVIASKEEGGYPTNAIDANIYTDTDGKRYFIWGSFWDGIRIAPLGSDGTVSGVDMTSDASILSTSKTAGERIYTTPRGKAGPEGPWLTYNEQTGFRYLFTSYGWLGSNYNVRIARMPDDKTLSENKTFKDHNNISVGEPNDSAKDLWGYKLIGSYKLGDGITYVGQGHNSVLNNDGEWYLVDHCRKVEDGLAYLQVRKMLWTNDGWPVVSPLVYAGEKEQKIPESLIYGTWDLASVGHTIMKDGASASSGSAYKGSDLPVLSSEIVIQPDGRVSGDLGKWEFDGDHTVTITFAKDGNADNYEFYKKDDVMTLFVLTGYDKDKREKALVMTGVDQKHTAQFAKKNNLSASYADRYSRGAPENTEEIIIPKSPGGNPVLGYDDKGKRLYGGDPAAMVDGGRVYIYAGHDAAGNRDTGYVMPDWMVYSSEDMIHWEYGGSVMKAADISWASDKNSAWAAQAAAHNGKYYLYFCTWDKTSEGKQSIGVAVADSPEGPFKDIGHPLVKGTLTEPETSGWNDIDPTVWIEKDENGEEHIYLAWGNGIYYLCELNGDMISVKDINGDQIIDMNDIRQQSFTNMEGHGFTEAPWLYRRMDKDGNYYGDYYTFFASDYREQMSYAVSSDLSSDTWEYKGVIMPRSATSNTNHPSVIDFKGRTYFIYHNGALEKGCGIRRSVCIEELKFNPDGTVQPVKETSTGLTGNVFSISNKGRLLNYDDFENPAGDDDYPISKTVKFSYTKAGDNTEWEILKGSTDSEGYIQAVNKPGLYLCAKGNRVILTQNADGTLTKNMTFRTVKGIAGGGGISFESAANPGYFITSSSEGLVLTQGGYPEACEFEISQSMYYGQFSSEASDIHFEEGKLSAKVKVTNLSDKKAAFTDIAVLYDKDGNYKSSDIKYHTNAENSAERTVVFENAEEGDFFGYFVWGDILRCNPLAEKIKRNA